MDANKEAAALQYIKNIGPKRARLLNKMGIFNTRDLLYHIPRRYEDRSKLKPFHLLIDGEVETIKGTVLGLQDIKPRKGLTITKAALRDGMSMAYAVWFNQPFVKKQFQVGDELIITGKVDKRYGAVQVSVSDYEVIDDDDILHTGRIVPIYPVTEGLPQRALRVIMRNLLESSLEQVEDPLPEEIRNRYSLIGLNEAIANIHFPEKLGKVEKARNRLVFDELLALQLGLALLKNKHQDKVKGIAHDKQGPLLEKFMNSLPFPFTGAQERVIKEIFADMKRPVPMNRLLQGDVGSGKTVISAAALVKTVENQYQGILMAPTEILAEQHYLGLRDSFASLGIRTALLTGSTTRKEKKEILEEISQGTIDVVIGTHAIIQDEVNFSRLGLAITDEQHRFGVEQRAKLQEKGQNPDILVMTATPIPRTLSITLYGDLDVSIIDELPPGRQTIKTYWITEDKRRRMYDFVRQQIEEGRQAYFVCPLVEESEKIDVEAAVDMAERLKQLFPGFNIGLLHGRMKASDKEQVMEAFRQGDSQILVSTTVIEVGVNVPNASIMIVEDAERFGLAQLHQLRGRVGRGEHQSYCILLANPKTEEGRSRMQIMQATSDGFKIAEEDLKLRGPGDIFGTRQSGLPDLKIADLIRDLPLLEKARKTAQAIVSVDKPLKRPEHLGLRKLMMQMFRDKERFINIG